jgi:MFS family permease
MFATLSGPRTAILAVYAGFGACLGSWAGAIPVVSQAAGVSSDGLGLGLTAFTIAYVVAMSQGARLAHRLSNRSALLALLPAAGVATMALLLSANSAGLFTALIVFGATLGLLDLFMNSEAGAIEHELRRPVFAAFHGAASTGLPVFSLLSSFLSVLYGTWATALLTWIPLGLAWLIVLSRVPSRPQAPRDGSGGSTLRARPPLVLMGLAAGLIIACETAAIMWSARLLDEQAPEFAAVAGLGAAFFGLCNAALRYPGDALRRLTGDIPLMLGSLLLAIAGFAGLGISTGFAMSVAGFALVGLGTAVLIPCLFSLAASLVPANRSAGIGFVALIAGVPRALAPWIFGWIAKQFSTSLAFGLCALMLAAALVLIVILKNVTASPRNWGSISTGQNPAPDPAEIC